MENQKVYSYALEATVPNADIQRSSSSYGFQSPPSAVSIRLMQRGSSVGLPSKTVLVF